MLQNSSVTKIGHPDRHDDKLTLCVDLDGTLVKSDCLWEAVLKLAKTQFFTLFLLPFWVLRGKAVFKDLVFRRAKLNPELLPYNDDVIAHIRMYREMGHRTVLATASPQFFAEEVAQYLQLFDEVKGSSPTENLSGKAKAKWLESEFGAKQYYYVGNSHADLPVWKSAKKAFVVTRSWTLISQVKKIAEFEVFLVKGSLLKQTIKAIRVHQWAKNLLLFIPLILAHKFSDLALYLECVIAFVSFSMVSSSVYLINDLLDLESDRHHPDNRLRPFAAGNLSIPYGLMLVPVLMTLGGILSLEVSGGFSTLLATYFVLTLSYSLYFKEIVLTDIFMLATLYSLRVYAGSVITGIALSNWLFIFSCSLFLSLALLKRCSEIMLLKIHNKTANPRRGYQLDDFEQLMAFGTSSGYLSVLVLALYIYSQQEEVFYTRPQVLWLICPFLLYWISRMWLKAHRGKMHSDPLVFAFKDKPSHFIMAMIAVAWLVAAGYLV
jgi:4-hydroxybenzoate polyprenyltransferase/phosphoserine phosphatase